MKNLALDRIRRIKNYVPGISGRIDYSGLLLDFNERTKPVSEKALQALRTYIDSGKISVYPQYDALEEKIAAYAGIDADCVMLTNGSEHGIDIIMRTFVNEGDRVVIPSPSFSMHEQYALASGAELIQPLYANRGSTFPKDEILGAIKHGCRLIIICNPGSPTGTLVSLKDIEMFVQEAEKTDTLIYIDEAYVEFSKVTAAYLVKKYSNLIITRTFSKAFGLAGLRIGYTLASSVHCSEMEKARGPYPVNMAAVSAAHAALNDVTDMEQYVNEVMDRAKPYVENFFHEKHIAMCASAGNYILFWPANAEEVTTVLSKKGFAIRSQNREGIEGAVRVSIGTMEQMKAFVEAYPS